MSIIDIDKIIAANEWFISAEEKEVLEVLESQPVLSGLVNVILEEDLLDAEEYSKDLFYSLYGSIVKSYSDSFGKDALEVSEDDIEKAFEKQNKFAELLSSSLGFSDGAPTADDENKAIAIMEKLASLEERYNNDESFDLSEEGLGDLSELMGQVNEEMKQPSMNAFIQSELEHAELDDNIAGLLNQQFNIIVDSFENMLERGSTNTDMKIV
ncbi:MAG: hypothetical protein KAH10_06035 [Flavobacteriales bacterium]|nr:hypothetical protein [Flavobacteriales bacterium]